MEAEARLSDRRAEVLASLSRRHMPPAPLPDFQMPPFTEELVAHFTARAKASAASVHEIVSPAEAPRRIAEILREAGHAPELHLPAVSPLNALPWSNAPEMVVTAAPPSGTESALSSAEFGIAETGTLVFFSGPQSHSSWHFRPGREFILIDRKRILPRLEDVIALVGSAPPATINLITGPSRTADIEQTIEMGAHGPREVHILITG